MKTSTQLSCCSLLLSQEDKLQSHRTVREISRQARDPSIVTFADYLHKDLRLKCCKRRPRSTADWSAQHALHALFTVCSLGDDNVITSNPAWKMKHANSILESFEYFCQISSKSIHIISSYTVSKLGHFLKTQCSLRFFRLSMQRSRCSLGLDSRLLSTRVLVLVLVSRP